MSSGYVGSTGHHVVHVYAAANEPYDIWKGLSRTSPEYKQLKAERAEVGQVQGPHMLGSLASGRQWDRDAL